MCDIISNCFDCARTQARESNIMSYNVVAALCKTHMPVFAHCKRVPCASGDTFCANLFQCIHDVACAGRGFETMRVLLSPWSTRFARSGSLMKGACLAGHVWLAFAGNTLVHACVGVSAPSTAFVRPLEKSMRVSCGKEEREFCDADKYTERGRAKIPGGEIGVWDQRSYADR